MRVSTFRLSFGLSFLLFASVAVPACGPDESTTSTTGTVDAGDDGKYHPAGNGTHTSEEAACEALSKAQETKALGLSCAATTRPCPEFLRATFGVECMEYDEGSVQGCIAYYNEQTTCQGFNTAVNDCIVTPFPGTEPSGCP